MPMVARTRAGTRAIRPTMIAFTAMQARNDRGIPRQLERGQPVRSERAGRRHGRGARDEAADQADRVEPPRSQGATSGLSEHLERDEQCAVVHRRAKGEG